MKLNEKSINEILARVTPKQRQEALEVLGDGLVSAALASGGFIAGGWAMRLLRAAEGDKSIALNPGRLNRPSLDATIKKSLDVPLAGRSKFLGHDDGCEDEETRERISGLFKSLGVDLGPAREDEPKSLLDLLIYAHGKANALERKFAKKLSDANKWTPAEDEYSVGRRAEMAITQSTVATWRSVGFDSYFGRKLNESELEGGNINDVINLGNLNRFSVSVNDIFLRLFAYTCTDSEKSKDAQGTFKRRKGERLSGKDFRGFYLFKGFWHKENLLEDLDLIAEEWLEDESPGYAIAYRVAERLVSSLPNARGSSVVSILDEALALVFCGGLSLTSVSFAEALRSLSPRSERLLRVSENTTKLRDFKSIQFDGSDPLDEFSVDEIYGKLPDANWGRGSKHDELEKSFIRENFSIAEELESDLVFAGGSLPVYPKVISDESSLWESPDASTTSCLTLQTVDKTLLGRFAYEAKDGIVKDALRDRDAAKGLDSFDVDVYFPSRAHLQDFASKDWANKGNLGGVGEFSTQHLACSSREEEGSIVNQVNHYFTSPDKDLSLLLILLRLGKSWANSTENTFKMPSFRVPGAALEGSEGNSGESSLVKKKKIRTDELDRPNLFVAWLLKRIEGLESTSQVQQTTIDGIALGQPLKCHFYKNFKKIDEIYRDIQSNLKDLDQWEMTHRHKASLGHYPNSNTFATNFRILQSGGSSESPTQSETQNGAGESDPYIRDIKVQIITPKFCSDVKDMETTLSSFDFDLPKVAIKKEGGKISLAYTDGSMQDIREGAVSIHSEGNAKLIETEIARMDKYAKRYGQLRVSDNRLNETIRNLKVRTGSDLFQRSTFGVLNVLDYIEKIKGNRFAINPCGEIPLTEGDKSVMPWEQKPRPIVDDVKEPFSDLQRFARNQALGRWFAFETIYRCVDGKAPKVLFGVGAKSNNRETWRRASYLRDFPRMEIEDVIIEDLVMSQFDMRGRFFDPVQGSLYKEIDADKFFPHATKIEIDPTMRELIFSRSERATEEKLHLGCFTTDEDGRALTGFGPSETAKIRARTMDVLIRIIRSSQHLKDANLKEFVANMATSVLVKDDMGMLGFDLKGYHENITQPGEIIFSELHKTSSSYARDNLLGEFKHYGSGCITDVFTHMLYDLAMSADDLDSGNPDRHSDYFKAIRDYADYSNRLMEGAVEDVRAGRAQRINEALEARIDNSKTEDLLVAISEAAGWGIVCDSLKSDFLNDEMAEAAAKAYASTGKLLERYLKG